MRNRRVPARLPLPVLLGLVGLLMIVTPTPAVAADPRGRWPLDPQPPVVDRFDPPDVEWGSGHRGVDLVGRVRQPVRAALAGTVSFTGRIAGVAVVVVDHGPTRTTYQPVAASVARGTHVEAGQVIGRLEWFGTHCAPRACLHWGWLAGSEYLDPLRLVGAAPRPVRLLPLTTPLTTPLGTPFGPAPVTSPAPMALVLPAA